MSVPVTQPPRLFDEHGFSLIELLVAMIMGLVISLAAFSILEFTTSDVSRITARAHVSQTGRVALEKLMLQLHSACVSVNVNPIQAKSSGTTLKFVSETSPVNSNHEPSSSFSTVKEHEITYTPPSGKIAGTLIEKSRTSIGLNNATGEYEFNPSEKPTEIKLLSGVRQTVREGKEAPIFQYYRYYTSKDSEAKLGQIDPGTNNLGMNNTEMAKEEVKEKRKYTEAEKVAKVTVGLTLAPEGYEGIIAKGGQPVALEDSAVLRFTPSSEEASSNNYPCSEI
jgi:prepilin-type N-terminal cleavage/methylation domain-containing protein